VENHALIHSVKNRVNPYDFQDTAGDLVVFSFTLSRPWSFLAGQATKLTKSRGSGIRYGNFQRAIKQ
jgi:hypothetical protein